MTASHSPYLQGSPRAWREHALCLTGDGLAHLQAGASCCFASSLILQVLARWPPNRRWVQGGRGQEGIGHGTLTRPSLFPKQEFVITSLKELARDLMWRRHNGVGALKHADVGEPEVGGGGSSAMHWLTVRSAPLSQFCKVAVVKRWGRDQWGPRDLAGSKARKGIHVPGKSVVGAQAGSMGARTSLDIQPSPQAL